MIERIPTHAETGVCVLRVKARTREELIMPVGHSAAISASDWTALAANAFEMPHFH
jgi:hypothetical protein